jgi:aspartate carbamoyltransferase catalytic subunit
MNPDVIVLRHSESGSAHFVSRCLARTAVVNAGDGSNEHPTQALLDLLTLKQHFARFRDTGLEGLKIGFVGDVRHSRVARSGAWAHLALGNEVRFVGPTTLVPHDFADAFGKGRVKIFHDLAAGIEGLDVIVSLRMQLERQDDNFVPNLDEYSREYCLTEQRLGRYAPHSVVLHPGPMNRGTEIAGDIADGPRALIRNQVNNGVAVRMAVLYLLARSSAQVHEESGA